MLKLLGLISILTGSVIMGFVMANELRERCKVLKDIHRSAIHIKSDLEYRSSDLRDCFKMRGKLFSNAEKYMTNDNLLPCEAVAKSCKELTALKKEDRDIILTYADNLYSEDIGGQITNIAWLIDSIALNLKEAECDYLSKSRVYRSGGALAGFAFVILLI